jgi:hypothetical protein
MAEARGIVQVSSDRVIRTLEEAEATLGRLFVACVEHGFVGDVFWNHSGGNVSEGVGGVQGALLDGKLVERNELVAWVVVGHDADKSVRVSANFRVSVNPGTTFAVSTAASKFEASKALGLAVALLSAQGGGRAAAWFTGKNKFLETASDAPLPEGARAVREGGYAFRLIDAAMNPAP